MDNTKSLSEQIADFTLNLRLEQIPPDVVSFAKWLLFDSIGVAMSCQNMKHAIAVRRAVLETNSQPECTLWGTSSKVQLADAVLYNSCLIHGADYDDTHVGGIVHPSAAVMSTAITVGEKVQASGAQMMEAMVVGWEVIVRLALAAKGRFHDVGYHGSGIVAPFAAACVAAKLLGLPKETLVNALGICGSQSAALQEFLHDGTWVKKIHPGWGAHSAIYALNMAKHGFTGPLRVFEGEFGLWKTHLGATDGLEEAFRNLGTVWHTTEISFKMYPVCHMTHSFIDCTIDLLQELGLPADEIASIECRVDPRYYPIVCEPRKAKIRPQTDYMMRFSLPYVVAVAAYQHKVSPFEVDMKYAQDPSILSLMKRIHCISDMEQRNPGHFPGWIQLTTQDGRTYTREQRYEIGASENPVSEEAVRIKFQNNLSAYYSEEKRRKLVDKIYAFDTLAQAEELLNCLTADRKMEE